MYKINYKGMEVEVDSVRSLDALIEGGIVEKRREFNNDIAEYKVEIREKKHKKHNKYNQWTADEVHFIIASLPTMSLSRIAKSKKLLDRHTAGANFTMISRVRTGSKNQPLSADIQKIVDKYQKDLQNKTASMLKLN